MMSSTRLAVAFVWLLVPVCAHAHQVSRGGAKHVEIDKSTQTLRAYEGEMLVFESNVSTGRHGKETPNGRFHAESKSLMHYSHLYDNAPMPYSVQINSNYFIHGFSYVPSFPASHGCIRMPIGSARQFYDWISLGTPVEIVGSWSQPSPERVAEKNRRYGSAPTSNRGGYRSIRHAIPVAHFGLLE